MKNDMAAVRQAMVDGQLKPNEVNDPALLSAFLSVPRELFVPKAKRGIAYVDEDIALGHGRYLMEPMIFGRLMDFADINKDSEVLVVGCATGYAAAIAGHLAGAVVALESDADLVAKAESTIASLDIMNVAVVEGDLKAGLEKEGPYDVIILDGAVEDIPEALSAQLKDGGRLLTVLVDKGVGRAHMVTRRGATVGGRNLFDANVQLLPGFTKEGSFVF